MPRFSYIALGSNTTVKAGEGYLYGLTVSGANGGSVVVQDSIGIGVTPNLVTLPTAVGSNIAHIATLGATPTEWRMFGVPFQDGLTIAATSNANITVYFD